MICPRCDNEIKYGSRECPHCGLHFKYRNRSGASRCKRSTASYLCLAFGALGLHHFYLGYFMRGAVRLALFMAFCGLFISPLMMSIASSGTVSYTVDALGICGLIALAVNAVSYAICLMDFVHLILGDTKTDAKGLTLM